jgi:hypothetical protein
MSEFPRFARSIHEWSDMRSLRRWLLWPTCAIRGHRLVFYGRGEVVGHPERFSINRCGCGRRAKVEEERI